MQSNWIKEMEVTTDLDGNQIIDESAISASMLLAEIEELVTELAIVNRNNDDLLKQIASLKEEVQMKQDVINKVQLDEYFKSNYPDQSQ